MLRTVLALPQPLLRRIVGPPLRVDGGAAADLQLQAMVLLMRAAGEPPLHAGPPSSARRAFDAAMTLVDGPPVRDVVATDRSVPGAAGPLRARVYAPALGLAASGAPGIVWLHGGGFVLGSIESHDYACRVLSARARAIVVSVDYRLAPEHPFPAAVEDAIAATRWLITNASSLGIDPRAVAVGGDSAGGNLAAVVAQALRGEKARPALQVLLYPATDCRRGAKSHALFQDGFLLERESIDWFMKCYLPDPGAITDPRASPLLAPDLSGLPPAIVLTAGFDPLRDEGDAYAEAMAAAGVDVEHYPLPTMMHGFFTLTGVVREADRIMHRLAHAVSVGLARSGLPAATDAAAAPTRP